MTRTLAFVVMEVAVARSGDHQLLEVTAESVTSGVLEVIQEMTPLARPYNRSRFLLPIEDAPHYTVGKTFAVNVTI
jgi:hypothetical protein